MGLATSISTNLFNLKLVETFKGTFQTFAKKKCFFINLLAKSLDSFYIIIPVVNNKI